MKNSRLIFICLFVFFFLVSNVVIFPQHTSAADLSWSTIYIPSKNVVSDNSESQWVLAEGSDVRCLTAASNGDLYCSAKPSGTPYTLFRSTNRGSSWSYFGLVEKTIIDIAISPVDSNRIYYSTSSEVYKYLPSESKFIKIGENPGGAGLNGKIITSLDVAVEEGRHHIVVGLCDNDSGEYGGVYIWDEGESWSWENIRIGDLDVHAVAFSPDFDNDREIISVASNEVDTVITVYDGIDWGLTVGNAWIIGITPEAASLAFTSDYQLNPALDKYTQFFAIDTGIGNGDVYCVNWQFAPEESKIIDLDIGFNYDLTSLDIASLSVIGNTGAARLMAGASDSSDVYFSNDDGSNWFRCNKPPSGDSGTCVLISSDYFSTGIAYAATCGSESAFSITRDGAISWNQIGLIDTRITTILDLGISPDYDRDNVLFILTSNIQDSLWYSSDGGSTWERRYCTSERLRDKVNLILLSPEFASNDTLFMAGTSDGKPVIWKSEDRGISFSQTISIDPDSNSVVPISNWTIAPGDILFVSSFDGNHGLIYSTPSSSLNYVSKSIAGNQDINQLVISPDFTNDHTLLAGNIDGRVFYSNDSGIIFVPIPFESESPPFSGNVTVAFDAGFRQNKTFYAAGDDINTGIYRYVIGQSLGWNSINSSLPDGAQITELVSSKAGLLYALNVQTVYSGQRKGGIERSYDPSNTNNVHFETVTDGLVDGHKLKGLWVQGNNLWTIDVSTAMPMQYTDILNSPLLLISPDNSSSVTDLDDVIISWEKLVSTNKNIRHCWQVDTDDRFLDIPSGFEGETDANWIKLKKLDAGMVYYWRVRACLPTTSPWSLVWLFYSDSENVLSVPTLIYPGTGSNYPVNLVFKWNAVENADNYDLMVSESDDFSNPVIDKSGANACNTNAWANEMELKYATSYYWKVRAVNTETAGPWSSTSIFITKNKPSSGGSSSSGSGSEKPSPESKLAKPVLSEPKLNAQVAVQPVFKWSAVTGADAYELVVSKNDSFSSLAINKTGDNICHANVWKCDTSLEYSVNYYWKVRALGGGKISDWSSVSIFSTESEPVNTPSSLSPTPPVNSPETSPVNSNSTPVGNNSTPVNKITSTSIPIQSTQPGVTGFSSIPAPNTSAVSEVTLSNSAVWQIFFIFGSLIILIGISSFGVIILSRKFKRNQ